MEVWKAIYNAYSENQLIVSPFGGADVRTALEQFVDTLNPPPRRKNAFRNCSASSFAKPKCACSMRALSSRGIA